MFSKSTILVVFGLVLAVSGKSTNSRCQYDGQFLQHESDCAKFYRCSANLIPYEFECPGGLHWNHQELQCDWPENAMCDLEGCSITSPPPKCPNNGSPLSLRLLPHQYDCNQYYVCLREHKYPSSCPTGLHFNPKTEMCDLPNAAGCACA